GQGAGRRAQEALHTNSTRVRLPWGAGVLAGVFLASSMRRRGRRRPTGVRIRDKTTRVERSICKAPCALIAEASRGPVRRRDWRPEKRGRDATSAGTDRRGGQ